MKLLRVLVASNFVAGMLMIIFGVYYQFRHFDGSGFYKLGFLVVVIAIVLWAADGYFRKENLGE